MKTLIRKFEPLLICAYWFRRKVTHRLYWKNMSEQGSERKRSVVFFTTHKSASTFISGFLKDEIGKYGYQHMDYSSALWRLNYFFKDVDDYEIFFSERFSNLFRLEGCIYGPHRQLLKHKDLDLFKKIIFLRNPLDTLVSSYYSFGNTHSVPVHGKHNKSFLERRDSIVAKTIDEYVLEASEKWLFPIFADYDELLCDDDKALVLRYEDYIHDTRVFLCAFFEFLNINVEATNIDQMVTEIVRELGKISSDGHQRSGAEGQYRYELAVETVDTLVKKYKQLDLCNLWFPECNYDEK